ncbi:unnamed protein product [Amoebophrya sp. A25]|nr:unnamed protein product [Amoebophrya sp. A25]|eukprot:GSA25T00003481001.1
MKEAARTFSLDEDGGKTSATSFRFSGTTSSTSIASTGATSSSSTSSIASPTNNNNNNNDSDKRTVLDICFLDVEMSEKGILENLDWTKLQIGLLSFEFLHYLPHERQELMQFLRKPKSLGGPGLRAVSARSYHRAINLKVHDSECGERDTPEDAEVDEIGSTTASIAATPTPGDRSNNRPVDSARQGTYRTRSHTWLYSPGLEQDQVMVDPDYFREKNIPLPLHFLQNRSHIHCTATTTLPRRKLWQRARLMMLKKIPKNEAHRKILEQEQVALPEEPDSMHLGYGAGDNQPVHDIALPSGRALETFAALRDSEDPGVVDLIASHAELQSQIAFEVKGRWGEKLVVVNGTAKAMRSNTSIKKQKGEGERQHVGAGASGELQGEVVHVQEQGDQKQDIQDVLKQKQVRDLMEFVRARLQLPVLRVDSVETLLSYEFGGSRDKDGTKGLFPRERRFRQPQEAYSESGHVFRAQDASHRRDRHKKTVENFGRFRFGTRTTSTSSSTRPHRAESASLTTPLKTSSSSSSSKSFSNFEDPSASPAVVCVYQAKGWYGARSPVPSPEFLRSAIAYMKAKGFDLVDMVVNKDLADGDWSGIQGENDLVDYFFNQVVGEGDMDNNNKNNNNEKVNKSASSSSTHTRFIDGGHNRTGRTPLKGMIRALSRNIRHHKEGRRSFWGRFCGNLEALEWQQMLLSFRNQDYFAKLLHRHVDPMTNHMEVEIRVNDQDQQADVLNRGLREQTQEHAPQEHAPQGHQPHGNLLPLAPGFTVLAAQWRTSSSRRLRATPAPSVYWSWVSNMRVSFVSSFLRYQTLSCAKRMSGLSGPRKLPPTEANLLRGRPLPTIETFCRTVSF